MDGEVGHGAPAHVGPAGDGKYARSPGATRQHGGGTLIEFAARLKSRLLGPTVPPTPPPEQEHLVSDYHRRVLEQVRPYTMTSDERILCVLDAVEHLVARDIGGAFVECGVWRGGSVLAMVLALQGLRVTDRDLYLFDTFEGMTEPTEQDISRYSRAALDEWHDDRPPGTRAYHDWFGPDVFGLDGVTAMLEASGYPRERLHFVVGDVLATIPDEAPDAVALLRLDTDWYESTRHELEHLYPRLATGGVLIVDDYGHWEGCQRAVDEYFTEVPRPLLTRLDYTGRIGIRT